MMNLESTRSLAEVAARALALAAIMIIRAGARLRGL